MTMFPPARIGKPTVRHRLLVVGVMLAILLLAGRLVWVQGLNAGALAAQAVEDRTTKRVIPALRGDIVDRDGTVMATSVQRYDLWVNQKQVGEYKPADRPSHGVKAAAEDLAPIFGWTVDETQAKLTGDKGFQYLLKDVDPAVRQAVMDKGIPGIGSDPVARRIYPGGQVGGNLLGFVGSEGKAMAGVESSDDKVLRGKDGYTQYERGAGGQIIPTGHQETSPAVDGSSVLLSIDSDLQWKTQEVLAAAVDQFGGSGGSAVVLNARTGEVLTLADYPTFDPNDYGRADPDLLRVQSISNVFEPGSTGKLFTMAAALDQGKVSLESNYTIPYTMNFQGERIKDSHEHETQQLTLAGVLKNSSNVGTVQVSETLSPQTRYDYLRSFGLGQKTGIELPAESAGIVHPADDWTGRMRYTTAFGQGYSVTALQVTSAVGAFANDGVRVQPTIVKGTREADGTVTASPAPEQHRVISSQTAETMLKLMDNDIPDDGTQNASVPDYAVAGKTGTAQTGNNEYTASFIGFAPADDPEIVVGVFVYGLKTFIPGNTAAAPAFSQIMQYALQTQGIAPTGRPGTELTNEW